MDDLLQALTLPEPQAHAAWLRWRVATVIDTLPYACHVMLPALNSRLPAWLAGDPKSGILQGIVRQIWTQNQLRLRICAEVVNRLQDADLDAAIAGPPACALHVPPPAIRAIPYLRLLIDRSRIFETIDALKREGWRTDAIVEPGANFDYFDHVCFSRENVYLFLCWRLIPLRPYEAASWEQAMAASLRSVKWNQQEFFTPSLEAALLEIVLAARHSDLLPWEADLALIDASGVDREALRKLALRFAPESMERLGLAPATPLELKIREIKDNYRQYIYYRYQQAGVRSFLRFLAVQWGVSSIWLLPFAAFGRAFRHSRRLLR